MTKEQEIITKQSTQLIQYLRLLDVLCDSYNPASKTFTLSHLLVTSLGIDPFELRKKLEGKELGV